MMFARFASQNEATFAVGTRANLPQWPFHGLNGVPGQTGENAADTGQQLIVVAIGAPRIIHLDLDHMPDRPGRDQALEGSDTLLERTVRVVVDLVGDSQPYPVPIALPLRFHVDAGPVSCQAG